MLMSVNLNSEAVKGREVLHPGLPKALFDTGTKFSTRRPYTSTRDGQRFLIVTKAPGEEENEPISVMINWTAGLKP